MIKVQPPLEWDRDDLRVRHIDPASLEQRGWTRCERLFTLARWRELWSETVARTLDIEVRHLRERVRQLNRGLYAAIVVDGDGMITVSHAEGEDPVDALAALVRRDDRIRILTTLARELRQCRKAQEENGDG